MIGEIPDMSGTVANRTAMKTVIKHLIFELRVLTSPWDRRAKDDLAEILDYVYGQIECVSDEE